MLEIILKDLRQPLGYLPAGILAGIVIVSARYLCRKEKCTWQQYLLWFLFSVYMAVTLIQAFFSREPGSRVSGMDLVPFHTWGSTLQSHAYVVENILMFIPFGILAPLVFFKMKWWQTVLLGMLFSSGIELMQLWTGRGYCQLDDVMMNTIGTCIGVTIIKSWKSLSSKK